MIAKKVPVKIFNPGSAAECFRDVVEAYTEYKIVAEQEQTKRRGIEAWEKATIADIQAKRDALINLNARLMSVLRTLTFCLKRSMRQ